MAANFQNGRHGLSRNTGFALDGSRQSKRMSDIFEHIDSSVELYTTI